MARGATSLVADAAGAEAGGSGAADSDVASGAGAGASCLGSGSAAGGWGAVGCSVETVEASPMMARTEPTSASSSSWTRISSRVPVAGEGTSVSTLSVETSTSGSSTSMVSPTVLSQREMVPSVTDSPRAGRVTSVPLAVPAGSVEACWADGSGPGSLAAAGSGSAGESEPDTSDCSPMMARTEPTSASSSSWTRISSRVPVAGEGTSVSTLSVETSTSGSSTSMVSPTVLSQREMVPSVTDSPRAGRVTSVDMSVELLRKPRYV